MRFVQPQQPPHHRLSHIKGKKKAKGGLLCFLVYTEKEKKIQKFLLLYLQEHSKEKYAP